MDFKIAYRNVSEKSLNGYTGIEMIEMFDEAGKTNWFDEYGDIPENVWFSEEWWKYYFEYLHVVPESNQTRIGKLIVKNHRNNMSEHKGPKMLTDAEIYEMKFWHELEEMDYLKTKMNEDKLSL